MMTDNRRELEELLAATDKEIEKLESKGDLLAAKDREIAELRSREEELAAKDQEIAELRAQLEELQKQMTERRISIEETGSIAEASMRLNGVFESAQEAADQYLENIRIRHEEIDKICRDRDNESREKAIQLLERAQTECTALEEHTKRKCEEMLVEAQKESEGYWERLSERLETFYQAHAGLRELMSFEGSTGFRMPGATPVTPVVEESVPEPYEES